MFAACCLPYLSHRQVIISNKAKIVNPGKETLLCTLELKNKDTSGTLEDIRLDYEFYTRNTRIEESNIGHCFLSRVSRYRSNVFINLSPPTHFKVTKVKLNLGWKYRISQNEISFTVKYDRPPSTSSLRSPLFKPDQSTDEYDARLPSPSRLQLNKSPVSQHSIPPSPSESMLSLSEYLPATKSDSTSYNLIHAEASAQHSWVEAVLLGNNTSGVIEAGMPVHFKVIVKDTNGESLPKRTKYRLIVKLGNETIFSGLTHKTTFKITRIHSGGFQALFYINDELISGNPFCVNVLPSTPHALENVVFDVAETPSNKKRLKSQADVMYHNLLTTCSANIVDKHQNKVNQIYDVKVTSDPSIELYGVDLEDGVLQFKAKASKVGKFTLSFKLREEYSNSETRLMKDIVVRSSSMVDQFALGSYV